MIPALKGLLHEAHSAKSVAHKTTNSLTRAMRRLSIRPLFTASQSTKKFSAKKIAYTLFGASCLIGGGIALSSFFDKQLEEKVSACLKTNNLTPLLESENRAAVTRKIVTIAYKNCNRTALLSACEVAYICEIRQKLLAQQDASTKQFDAFLIEGLCQKLTTAHSSCSQFQTLAKTLSLFQLFQITVQLVQPIPKDPSVAASVTKQLFPEFEKLLFAQYPTGDIPSDIALPLWEAVQDKTYGSHFIPLYNKVMNAMNEECLKSPNILNYLPPCNIQLWPLPMRKDLIKRHALLLQERKIGPTEGSKHLLVTISGLSEPGENGVDVGLKDV